MGLETNGRWPWVTAELVVPAWSLAAVRRGELRQDGSWVAGLALPILVAHQSEEWLSPGGFLPVLRRAAAWQRPAELAIAETRGFHVNISTGWLSAVAGLVLWRRTPVAAAGVLWIEAGNGLMHASMATRERRYNPGVVTATMLMIPRAAAGVRRLARSGRVSRRQAVLASLAGIAFAGGLPLALKMRMRRPSRLPPDG